MKEKLTHIFNRLWPINRSITGPGFRESLDILSEIIPMERIYFKSGSHVFDWTIPDEWIVHDAYFIDPNGKKHAEFKKNNLHLLGYSIPIKGKMDFAELRTYIFTLPEFPEAIPYRTSYYHKNWGFCITHKEYENLPDGIYDVFIDTEFKKGFLEIGEIVLKGESEQEILFSSYLCHPSMANNELSGPLVLTFLYDYVKNLKNRRYTYRFVLAPETIGAISYLSIRGMHLKEKLVAGYIMTCLGDNRKFTYKLSRQGNSIADRAAKIILRDNCEHHIIPFDPGNIGSDERQYCSPGFNLPVGSLMRSMYGTFSEYHTSLDNVNFISFDALVRSVNIYSLIVNAMETNEYWENTVMYCEPQLGRRGLYPTISSINKNHYLKDLNAAMLWLLNYADGDHDLLDIADISKHRYDVLIEASKKLSEAELIKKKYASE